MSTGFSLPLCQSMGSADSVFLIVGLGVVLGVVACFLWAVFLLMVASSVLNLLTTGVWLTSSLDSYFDHEIAPPFGEAWVGWYVLAGIAFAMLASVACLFPILM